MNGGKWLPTNDCKYCPNGQDHPTNDLVIVYTELEDGRYAVKESYTQT